MTYYRTDKCSIIYTHIFVSVTSISEVKASNLTPTTPQVPQISSRLSRQESLRPNNQPLPFIKQINEEVKKSLYLVS